MEVASMRRPSLGSLAVHGWWAGLRIVALTTLCLISFNILYVIHLISVNKYSINIPYLHLYLFFWMSESLVQDRRDLREP